MNSCKITTMYWARMINLYKGRRQLIQLKGFLNNKAKGLQYKFENVKVILNRECGLYKFENRYWYVREIKIISDWKTLNDICYNDYTQYIQMVDLNDKRFEKIEKIPFYG